MTYLGEPVRRADEIVTVKTLISSFEQGADSLRGYGKRVHWLTVWPSEQERRVWVHSALYHLGARRMRAFRFERDMMPVLEASVVSALAVPDDWHLRLLREPNLGGVVPDLLIGTSPIPLRSEHALAAAHSPLQGAVVHALREVGQVSLADLSARIFASTTAVERALEHLHAAGLVTAGFMGCMWRVSDDVELPVGVVAVEVKLRNWRRALEQARSYLAFAEQAWVAVDRDQVIVNDALLTAFEAHSVGLMTVSHSGIEAVVEPGPPAAPTAARYQAIARLLRA